MKQRCLISLIAVYCFGLLLHPQIVCAQFGELPPGQVSKTEQGLTDELALFMAFDPALLKDQLPEGLRFRTLREYATVVLQKIFWLQ